MMEWEEENSSAADTTRELEAAVHNGVGIVKISTKGRYALRMMADIAENQVNGYVALKEVAGRQDISKKYLEQIALRLSQAGMLQAVRGFQGGYMLSRPAEKYTVLQILEVVEGTIAPVACLDPCSVPCPMRKDCRTLPVWQNLEKRITTYLGSITLADIVAGRVDCAGEN